MKRSTDRPAVFPPRLNSSLLRRDSSRLVRGSSVLRRSAPARFTLRPDKLKIHRDSVAESLVGSGVFVPPLGSCILFSPGTHSSQLHCPFAFSRITRCGAGCRNQFGRLLTVVLRIARSAGPAGASLPTHGWTCGCDDGRVANTTSDDETPTADRRRPTADD